MKYKLSIHHSNNKLFHYLYALWQQIAIASIHKRGRCCIVLSGGDTPRGFYEYVCTAKTAFPWEQVHIFLVDERIVPLNYPESNGFMVEHFLKKNPLFPLNNFHRIPCALPWMNAVEEYDRNIRAITNCLDNEMPVFDLIMLGIGSDGHTASLFPESEQLDERRRAVVFVPSDSTHNERITLTLPVLNHARNIVFLVTGHEKAEIVKTVVTEKSSVYPAARVVPVSGICYMVLDNGAGESLKE